MRKAITMGMAIIATTFCINAPVSANSHSNAHATLNEVYAERSYQRAKEAALWSQPIMGVAMTLGAIENLGGGYNDIAYLSQPPNWKWRILTPNSVSLYVTSIIRTSQDEPVVVELPAVTGSTDIFGTIMDSFQVPLTDVGSSGADAGEGGKYLILPAAYEGDIPTGYIPVFTERNISYLMFRVIPSSFSQADLKNANEVIHQIAIYTLNNPQQRGKYIDVYDKVFNTVDPRDATYFDVLAKILNQETVAERDLIMMGMMESFGYVHGEAFEPSATTRAMLSKAVSSALDDLTIMTRDIADPWWKENPGWMQPIKPIGPMTQFKYVTESTFATDPRAETYSVYCCGPANLGAATAYIYAARDIDGNPLEAQYSYTLHVPANVPVKQFWSLTAYDAVTAVFFENVSRTDISSLQKNLQFNDDGSIDLYVGPTAPDGKESNWIETNSDNNAIFLFRFYGPEDGVKDGSWVMSGFKKIE
jgi:hypothetical protein